MNVSHHLLYTTHHTLKVVQAAKVVLLVPSCTGYGMSFQLGAVKTAPERSATILQYPHSGGPDLFRPLPYLSVFPTRARARARTCILTSDLQAPAGLLHGNFDLS